MGLLFVGKDLLDVQGSPKTTSYTGCIAPTYFSILHNFAGNLSQHVFGRHPCPRPHEQQT